MSNYVSDFAKLQKVISVVGVIRRAEIDRCKGFAETNLKDGRRCVCAFFTQVSAIARI